MIKRPARNEEEYTTKPVDILRFLVPEKDDTYQTYRLDIQLLDMYVRIKINEGRFCILELNYGVFNSLNFTANANIQDDIDPKQRFITRLNMILVTTVSLYHAGVNIRSPEYMQGLRGVIGHILNDVKVTVDNNEMRKALAREIGLVR